MLTTGTKDPLFLQSMRFWLAHSWERGIGIFGFSHFLDQFLSFFGSVSFLFHSRFPIFGKNCICHSMWFKFWKIWASTTCTACTWSRISLAVFCFNRNLFQFSPILFCSFVVSICTLMCTSYEERWHQQYLPYRYTFLTKVQVLPVLEQIYLTSRGWRQHLSS